MSTKTNRNTPKRSILAVVVLALFISGASLTPILNPTAQAGRECDDDCQEQLTAARAATAQYHNEGKALEDGFISTFQCVQVPGLGAMGVHYINPLRMMDTNVDASQPEILLFSPQNDGKMRLVGLEYYAPVLSNGAPWFGGPSSPPPVVDNPAPVLFGKT